MRDRRPFFEVLAPVDAERHRETLNAELQQDLAAAESYTERRGFSLISPANIMTARLVRAAHSVKGYRFLYHMRDEDNP